MWNVIEKPEKDFYHAWYGFGFESRFSGKNDKTGPFSLYTPAILGEWLVVFGLKTCGSGGIRTHASEETGA